MKHLNTIQVDDFRAEWLKPSQLAKRYSLSRSTIWRLTNEMRQIPKYKMAFIDLSQSCHLVRDADFLAFLRCRSGQYLKAVK